jgi:putative transposase
MDFVHEQLATGRKMRVLKVVNAFSRYSPVLDARFVYRGEDVARTLNQTCLRTGYPKRITIKRTAP